MNIHTPDADQVSYDPAEHHARVVVGDPEACAYEWICGYADILSAQVADSYHEDGYGTDEPVTVAELLRCADIQQPDANGKSDWDYISRGGAFEGESVEPMFWEKYAILRGLERDKVNDSGFFSCSC